MLNPETNGTAETVSEPKAKRPYAKHVTNRAMTRRSIESVGIKGRLYNVTTSVPKQMLNEVEAEAAASGVSRSDIARAALVRELAFRQYCRSNKLDPVVVSSFSVRPCKHAKNGKPMKGEPQKFVRDGRIVKDVIRTLKKAGIIA